MPFTERVNKGGFLSFSGTGMFTLMSVMHHKWVTPSVGPVGLTHLVSLSFWGRISGAGRIHINIPLSDLILWLLNFQTDFRSLSLALRPFLLNGFGR